MAYQILKESFEVETICDIFVKVKYISLIMKDFTNPRLFFSLKHQ